MGEKGKKNEGGEKKKSGEVVQNIKKEGNLTVVLKSDFHCEGCITKVVKATKSIEGVEKVMCDAESKKLTVIGKVDPVKLREKVEQKTHKHVELISPVPKKDVKGKSNGDGGDGDGDGGGDEKKKKKQNKEDDSKENKGQGKKNKEKEPPITTAVLKVHLHCQGCIQKIYKIVTKFKGYKEMKIDKQKDLVTITGSMDMKELAEMLKKHLKKEVEIVPPKKEGGEKKDKGGDNGGENGKGGGKGKGKGGEGNGEVKGKVKDEVGVVNGGEEMMIMGSNVGNGMQMMQQQVQFGYPYPYMYGPIGPVGPVYAGDPFQNPYPPVSVHAPQLFSDENPNACSIM
ncbi:unnamed protein product [Withania somnifera]